LTKLTLNVPKVNPRGVGTAGYEELVINELEGYVID